VKHLVLLVAVICILLTGCGPGGTGKENQDPTTEEAEQTTVTKGETTQTEVRTFVPFDSQGRLDTALRVEGSMSGSCWVGSLVTSRPDAWRCMSDSRILDPCFEDTTSRTADLACVSDPQGGGVTVLTLTETSPEEYRNKGAVPGEDDVWAFSLATGEICTRSTGAGPPPIGDLYARYYCGGEPGTTVYGEIDKTSERWKVLVWRGSPATLPSSPEQLEQVGVRVAWR
jgi:hypothetical protein